MSQYSCKQYFLACLLSTSPHRIPGRCPVSNHHFLDQCSRGSACLVKHDGWGRRGSKIDRGILLQNYWEFFHLRSGVRTAVSLISDQGSTSRKQELDVCPQIILLADATHRQAHHRTIFFKITSVVFYDIFCVSLGWSVHSSKCTGSII